MTRWVWLATIALCACTDAPEPTDGGVDASAADTGPAPEPCSSEGATECAPDAYSVRECVGGVWQVATDCLSDGQLCEAEVCVDPWSYGSPSFDACAGDPLATGESLVDKATYYDEIARRLHVHPDLGWIMEVRLEPSLADPSVPAVPQESATFDDVESWRSGENDGLWSALYMASQAYRYSVTGDAEALETLRLLMRSERQRMEITGVPGLFTRQMIPSGIAGLACPTDLASYVPDLEKDDNVWVRVGDGGCVEVVDGATMTWTTTDHCGLDAFAGWCWLDNVSKDEYAGHIFALGAVWRLVDDAALRDEAASMLAESARHLMDNDLAFVDWDGRRTEHGRLYATALDDFPGFNAAMVLALFRMAAEASGDAEIDRYYRECLLGNPRGCLPYDTERPRPYTERFGQAGLYVGDDDCLSNYNNISMHILSMHDLAWFAREPVVLEAVQRSLDVDVFRAEGHPRVALAQHNVWFDFIWAAMKALGPGSDGPAFDAVRDGVCMLRQFPARHHQPTLDTPARLTEVCIDRRGNPVAGEPREAAERCPGTFMWWADPYSLRSCTEDLRRIRPPQSYLLPYWMGRYYGFIDASM